MYRSVRWWMLSAILMGGLLTARPAFAATPGVKDHAEMFKPDTVKSVDAEIQQIKERYHLDVAIETFPAVPDDKKAEFEKVQKDESARNRFYRQWAEERARSLGVDGVYTHIVKSPGHIYVALHETAKERQEFSDADAKK